MMAAGRMGTVASSNRRPQSRRRRHSTAMMQFSATACLALFLFCAMISAQSSNFCSAFLPPVQRPTHYSSMRRQAQRLRTVASSSNIETIIPRNKPAVVASKSPLFIQQRPRNNMSSRSAAKVTRLLPALLFQALRRSFMSPLPALAAARSSGASSTATAAAATTNTAGGTTASNAAAAATAAAIALYKRLFNAIHTSISSITINRPRDLIRPVLIAATLIIATISVKDVISARKRQAVDATSEWGRYADDPAARGRALMTLCMRITPYLMVAQLLKVLPGGRARDTTDSEDGKKEGEQNKQNEEKEEEEKKWAYRKASSLRTASGNLFADGLLRLGPLYIKIGQILSCRENILPEEWVKPMEVLQDRVPAKSGQDALHLAYEAMPGGKAEFDRTFVEFDDVPLAAASLGQVHRAKLRQNNETVAIKVQRARLRDIYDKDLALMHKIASAVDKFAGKAGNVGGVEQSWNDIFTDAEVILYREIDYRDEAENAARFANDFGLGIGGKPIQSTATSIDGKPLPSASSWVRTPYTYKELSSEKILVMEFVPSIKISDDAKLNAAGVTVEDKELLAESLARSYLRQFCANRFFSTDPHPGNLGVEVFDNDESVPRLVFYDFGQACSLSEDQAGGVLDVIEGIVDMDAEVCVTAFDRMGVLKDGADLDKVRRKVQSNFDTGKIKVKKTKARMKARNARRSSSKKKKKKKKDIAKRSEIVNGTNATNTTANATDAGNQKKSSKKANKEGDPEVMEFFTLPAEYAFVARAISQMDGVGKGLDPEFDFISASAPYLVEVKGATTYLLDEARKTVTGIEKEGTKFQAKLLERFGWDASAYTTKKRSSDKK